MHNCLSTKHCAGSALFKIMKKQRFNRIPEIGTPIQLSYSLVQQKPDSNGDTGTPMCKIKYDMEDHVWKMVPIDHSGLMVFLNDMPNFNDKCIKISKIVGSGNAAYADILVNCQ